MSTSFSCIRKQLLVAHLPVLWRSTGPSLKVHVMAGLGWPAASQTRRADDPSCTSTSSGVTTNFGFTAHTHKILSEGNKSTLSGIDE